MHSVLRMQLTHSRCQVRAALQDMVRKAVDKMKASVPNGPSDDIVAFLTSQLATESLQSGNEKPGEKSVNLWFNAESAAEVRRWTLANNNSAVTSQAAYVAALSTVTKRLCEESVSTDSISLGDLIYTHAEAIFGSVPAAVPTFAVAMCVKIDAAEQKQSEKNPDLKQLVPDFSHFLCSSATVAADENEESCLISCAGRCSSLSSLL